MTRIFCGCKLQAVGATCPACSIALILFCSTFFTEKFLTENLFRASFKNSIACSSNDCPAFKVSVIILSENRRFFNVTRPQLKEYIAFSKTAFCQMVPIGTIIPLLFMLDLVNIMNDLV